MPAIIMFGLVLLSAAIATSPILFKTRKCRKGNHDWRYKQSTMHKRLIMRFCQNPACGREEVSYDSGDTWQEAGYDA